MSEFDSIINELTTVIYEQWQSIQKLMADNKSVTGQLNASLRENKRLEGLLVSAEQDNYDLKQTIVELI